MPRDPNRIGPTLQLVRLYWQLHPDLRLGQLITQMGDQLDPFYLEDDRLQQKLREALKAHMASEDQRALDDFLGLAERQQDLSAEQQRLVDEHFWELVGDTATKNRHEGK